MGYRGRPRRQERLQCTQTRRPRRAQPRGHQGDAEPDLERPRQDPVFVAVVLLRAHP